ncbi:MAG: glutathione S-transferase [Methylococcales bacterium]|nr:glutathione S-transferase [Methylococcales bacterium]
MIQGNYKFNPLPTCPIHHIALPILYSFRRCPYAMRARMVLKQSQYSVHLREVVLRDKPDSLLNASSKSTVPVLILPDGAVIDESLEIMLWALSKNDPEQWLLNKDHSAYSLMLQLIKVNDSSFKHNLDRYKYSDRYPEQQAQDYRAEAETFLALLEDQLNRHTFLLGNTITMADIAIFPFIRQFAHVDLAWFQQAPYPKLQTWLDYFLQSGLFHSVMAKYPQWKEGDDPIVF